MVINAENSNANIFPSKEEMLKVHIGNNVFIDYILYHEERTSGFYTATILLDSKQNIKRTKIIKPIYVGSYHIPKLSFKARDNLLSLLYQTSKLNVNFDLTIDDFLISCFRLPEEFHDMNIEDKLKQLKDIKPCDYSLN